MQRAQVQFWNYVPQTGSSSITLLVSHCLHQQQHKSSCWFGDGSNLIFLPVYMYTHGKVEAANLNDYSNFKTIVIIAVKFQPMKQLLDDPKKNNTSWISEQKYSLGSLGRGAKLAGRFGVTGTGTDADTCWKLGWTERKKHWLHVDRSNI